MVKWDSSFETGHEKSLKGRLAEVVRDKSLHRELCCLNVESLELGYFDLQDCALRWLGSGACPQRSWHGASQFEVKAREGTDLRAVIKRQEEQLQELQGQLPPGGLMLDHSKSLMGLTYIGCVSPKTT